MKIAKGETILALDKELFQKRSGVARLVYQKPTNKEVCMSFDNCWDREATYFNIVKDDGFYRMYYVALNRVDDEGNLVNLSAKAHMAVIESKDGITWYKPVLGLVQFNGNKNNNIIDLNVFDNAYIYKDENPNCPPDKKYKAVYMHFDGNATTQLRCSFSSDGLSFKDEMTITDKGTFDSLNVAFFDESKKRYVCYFRNFHNVDGSDFKGFKDVLNAENKAIRDIRVMYSEDFITWSEPKRLTYEDRYDYQLYTNNVIKYFNAPRYYLGFPERYTERQEWDVNFENLCSKKIRKESMKFHPRLGLATTDQLFMFSTDGEHFIRSEEAFIFPGLERNGGWIYGAEKMCYGIIETLDPFGVNTELSMYYPFSNPFGAGTKLMRCTLRKDGFACFEANNSIRHVYTKPFTFSGDKLFMNISTSTIGFVQVYIKDTAGNSIISNKIFGDGINKEIVFDDNCLKTMANKQVVMTINIKNAQVYSLKFM